MPSALIVLLTLAAVARLTRLVTTDTLTEPFRNTVRLRFGEASMWSYWANCDWCASIWISFPVAALAYAAHGAAWFTIPALALTASLAAGIHAELT